MTNEELQAIGALMDQKLTPLREELAQVKQEVAQVRGLLENDINPAIDALVEGQELTHDLMRYKVDRDEVTPIMNQISALKQAVAAHSREIEKLKKAQ